jgi:hypothetical protein
VVERLGLISVGCGSEVDHDGDPRPSSGPS